MTNDLKTRAIEAVDRIVNKRGVQLYKHEIEAVVGAVAALVLAPTGAANLAAIVENEETGDVERIIDAAFAAQRAQVRGGEG